MLRKIIICSMITAVLLLMTGCHLKEKIGENITEGIIDKAVGDDADIDIDDGELTMTNEDGETVTIDDENGLVFEGEDGSVIATGGEYEWPKGQAADYIPKFDGGKITYILNSDETCLLYIGETTIDDYKEYIETVADKGFTEDKMESSAEDMQVYYATTKDGVVISVYYINSENSLDITLDASAKVE
jgi:hypothetical protein